MDREEEEQSVLLQSKLLVARVGRLAQAVQPQRVALLYVAFRGYTDFQMMRFPKAVGAHAALHDSIGEVAEQVGRTRGMREPCASAVRQEKGSAEEPVSLMAMATAKPWRWHGEGACWRNREPLIFPGTFAREMMERTWQRTIIA